MGGPAQGTLSGLVSGKYYWRVGAVNGAFEQGAWSWGRKFEVKGLRITPALTRSRNRSHAHVEVQR
ncbi:MAG: hypothetical protein WKF96_23455 [Solirubrobacteraceae bacterium]